MWKYENSLSPKKSFNCTRHGSTFPPLFAYLPAFHDLLGLVLQLTSPTTAHGSFLPSKVSFLKSSSSHELLFFPRSKRYESLPILHRLPKAHFLPEVPFLTLGPGRSDLQDDLNVSKFQTWQPVVPLNPPGKAHVWPKVPFWPILIRTEGDQVSHQSINQSNLATSGPPESPWQGPRPLFMSPAHNFGKNRWQLLKNIVSGENYFLDFWYYQKTLLLLLDNLFNNNFSIKVDFKCLLPGGLRVWICFALMGSCSEIHS